MAAGDKTGSVRFDDFRFDPVAGVLSHRDGSPVLLGSRALAILGLLIERQGRLVSKADIFDSVWPGVAVEDGNLSVQISALRRVLDRDREAGSCI